MTPPRPIQAVLPVEPPVELGDTGRDLYAATLPVAFADAENAWAWAHFMGALSTLLDVIAEMARDDADGNPGWTALGSPTRCPDPWLRVLAQWAGVHRWDSMTSQELRDLIGPRAPGLWRGTPAAMRDAVDRFLPAGAPVYFVERAEGDPYLLRVFTFDYIEHDPEQVQAALIAAKPAGLTLNYELRHGQTWGMLNQRSASWGEVNTTYDTWRAVYDDAPLGAGTDPPTLEAINPNWTATPGDLLTLTGANFLAPATVTFTADPDVWEAPGTVASPTSLTCLCPDFGGVEFPTVTVTTPNGTSNGVPFSYG